MTTISISGLVKSFGTQSVLAGIDLFVPDGSFTAVLGPSGSGKTTLLRIIAGFDTAEEGRVCLGEHVVEDSRVHVAPEHRNIGFVPQDGALFPHLSAAGNVGFGLSRTERSSGRVDELLALVGLSGKGKRYPHQLSGGEQQRVALARALSRRPGVVLLDEPFSSLDTSLRAELRQDVRRVLSDAGATAVLVTHDQDEALSLADQVAVLRHGTVAQCGSPVDLYTHPVDPGMARFVGEANLVAGTSCPAGVETPLGVLPLISGNAPLGDSLPVVVLLRPEQVDIVPGAPGPGVPGRVVESRYYGHDAATVVEFDPPSSGSPSLPATLHARLANRPPLPVGSAVTVSASGPVTAWPAVDGTARPAAGSGGSGHAVAGIG